MKQTISFYLPDELIASFKAVTRSKAINRSELLRQLLERWLAEQSAAA